MKSVRSSIDPLPAKIRKAKPLDAVVRDAIRSRRERERDALRTTILHEAGALFVELGYDQFSMRKVAARIGYSATTIYHHFQDKDALLLALLGEAFCSFRQTLDDATKSASDPLDKVVALGRAYIQYAQNNPVFYHLMFLRRPDYLIRREEELLRGTNNGVETLMAAVAELQMAGYYQGHSVEAVANALWASTHGIVMLGMTAFQGQPDKVEAAIRVILQMDPRAAIEENRQKKEEIAFSGDRSQAERC